MSLAALIRKGGLSAPATPATIATTATNRHGNRAPVANVATVATTQDAKLAQASRGAILDGDVTAILLDSDLGPLWFAFDDHWKSGDDIPLFFASELPFLRRMTPDELRRRYAEKAALGGGWIRDKIDEPTKH